MLTRLALTNRYHLPIWDRVRDLVLEQAALQAAADIRTDVRLLVCNVIAGSLESREFEIRAELFVLRAKLLA